MRIPSGSTTHYVEFTAVDATDLQTKETGFGSTGWTVVTSMAGVRTVWTNPQVTEINSSDMPGRYALLVNQNSTITTGLVEQELGFYITHAGMMPRDFSIQLFENIYQAEIDFRKDETNSRDEYTIRWLKNNLRVTSGVTSPLIQVVKRADGTDLIAATAMTQIGSTGAYRYNASGAERQTDGEASIIVVSATIDGATRTDEVIRGRDATS